MGNAPLFGQCMFVFNIAKDGVLLKKNGGGGAIENRDVERKKRSIFITHQLTATTKKY